MPVRQFHLLTVTGLLVTSLLAVPLPGHAEQCSAKSSGQRVALLELYTSEGCNSCPPADKFLSSLRGQGLTLKQVLPLSLHVDYWNDLGWKDPYSRAQFSERQRDATTRDHGSFVYTPQFLLNGIDFRRSYFGEGLAEKVRQINSGKALAEINLTMKRRPKVLEIAGNAWVPTNREREPAKAYLLLYENNLSNSVNAGENKGATLHHDFVVRALIGPVALNPDGKADLAHRFTLNANYKPTDLGVAAFVQDSASGDVLQALALPVCR